MKKQTGIVITSAIVVSLIMNTGIATVHAGAKDGSLAGEAYSSYSLGSQDMVDVIIVYKNNKGKEKAIHESLDVDHEFKAIPAVSARITRDELNRLSKDPNIDHIEANIALKINGGEVQQTTIPAEESQWSFQSVKSSDMWSKGYTGAGVKVAIIDSGIMTTHPDLAVAGGVSTVDYTTSYEDDNGHGTHVAGIIGAKKNNIGMVGVAPGAKLYAVKAMGADGDGTLGDVLEGLDWSIQNKMDIINLSLSMNYDSELLHDMVDRAYNDGIIVISSAGNDAEKVANPEDSVYYPGKYSSVIAVSSVDQNMVRSSSSAMGPENEFSAPGVAIVSTWNSGKYAKVSGTSQAAPHVAGALAILKQEYPSMSNVQLREELRHHIKDLGVPGRDNQYGYGMVTFANETDDQVQGEVTNLKATEITESSMSISFTNPTTSNFTYANVYVNGVRVGTVTDGQIKLDSLKANTAYQIMVKVVDANGVESTGLSIDAKTLAHAALEEVSNLTVTEKSTTSLTLKWTNPTDPNFSKVNLYVDGVKVGEATESEYTFKGLTPNKSYMLTVKTVDSSGNESAGQLVNAKTDDEIVIPPVDTTAPAEVSALNTTEKTTTTVKLTWMNPTDTDFAKVNLYLNGVKVADTLGTEYRFSDLKPNTDYVISVKTEDTSRNESVGKTVNVTTNVEVVTPPVDTTAPAEVSKLTVSEKASSIARLSWVNPVDSDFAKVNLYLDGVKVGEVSGTEYSFTKLNPNQKYTVTAKTVDTAGNESVGQMINVTTESEVVTPPVDTTAPAEVGDLDVAEKSKSTIRLQWKNPIDADFVGVNLYLDGVKVGSVSGTDFSFTKLNPNQKYVLTVKTVDATGNESGGQTVSVTTEDDVVTPTEPTDTTPPAEVKDLTVTEKSPTSIRLTWVNPVDTDFARVNVYVNGSRVGDTAGTEYQVTGLKADTKYSIETRTEDMNGNESVGQMVKVTTDPEVIVPPADTTAPGEVLSLSPTEKSATTLKLTWKNPMDADFSKVILYLDDVKVGDTNSTEYSFTGLVPGRKYKMKATTMDRAGNESLGVDLLAQTDNEVVVSPVDITPPAEVSGLKVEKVTTDAVTFRWTNPTDRDFKSVHIYMSGVDGAKAITVTDSVYQVNGLEPSTNYTFVFKTVDMNGNESVGKSIVATTSSLPVEPPVNPPVVVVDPPVVINPPVITPVETPSTGKSKKKKNESFDGGGGSGGSSSVGNVTTSNEQATKALASAAQSKTAFAYVTAMAEINAMPNGAEKREHQKELDKLKETLGIKELLRKSNITDTENISANVATVTFNARYSYIDASSITSENVFVINNKGEVMKNIDVQIANGLIYVKSKDHKFESGEMYTIFIDKSVKTKMFSKAPFGRSLKNPLMMQFVIR
ncbi:chitodextrinase [Paenibacillus sp. 1182]|uniref:S8 family serine peptidase n=1 Tax=Paenibacillus sp. 1182 TaxID=2806565 RepID=UPI001AE13E5F|nr:S8 family serine peptidase [Paenibacillus sp. 1182]MBP1308840.1 chitodextrinase [Paenibacillus sp. 1182]